MTAETPEPVVSLLPAREGMRIMRLLTKHGGSMRLKPLLRSLDMDTSVFIEAARDLSERFWISIEWRTEAPEMEQGARRPHTDVDRLVVTWFGRWKWRRVWWMR